MELSSLDKRGSESLALYYVTINWHLTGGNATNHVTCVCSRGRDVEFKYRCMNKELIVKLKSSTICIGKMVNYQIYKISLTYVHLKQKVLFYIDNGTFAHCLIPTFRRKNIKP